MPTAIGNSQPSLVLTETIATEGIFPPQGGGGGGAMTIAMFHTYGFNFGLDGAPIAAGQLLPIAQNTAVFSLLGTVYGGNGQTNFALPDLRGRAANGDGQGAGLPAVQIGEQTGAASTILTPQQMPPSLGGASAPVDENQPELGIKYIIQAFGAFPSQDSGSAGLDMIGLVTKFAGNFVPAGYLECAGQLVNIAQYPDLFNLIGNIYGGDGVTTFAVPDLRGRTIVGAGGEYLLSEVFGQHDVTIGQANLPVSMGGNGTPIDNREPSVALNYIIALQGIFPSQSGGPHETEPFLGEIIAFAGNFAPRGFAFANGQLLSISQNTALFSLLGTVYGGNGQTTFALPDLRGRSVLGQGNGFLPGEAFGSDFTTLDLDDIPDLNYSGTDAAGTHYGGNGADTINALGGADTINAHGGNDNLDGGLGIDTAVFSGNRAAYAITRNGTTTNVVGPDGSDTATAIERLQFNDGTVVVDPTRNDFSGDGRADVLFRQIGQNFDFNHQWQLNDRTLLGEGGFKLFDKAFSVQVVGDFDGDGKADLMFWNPATGGAWEWRLDGTTILSEGAVDVGDSAYHLLGIGDLNGDGKDDVLFRNDAGVLFEWQMDGLDNTPLPIGPLDPAWHVQGTGDFNGDGNDDLLLRNISATVANGDFYLWQMNGNAIASEGFIETAPEAWKTLGIGDFDGDGMDDFAIRNVSATPENGGVWIYLMNGTTIKSQGAAGIADAATWELQQIADLNGDGRDDILYRNSAGVFYSWDMNGTAIASEGLLQGAAMQADPAMTVVKPFWDLV